MDPLPGRQTAGITSPLARLRGGGWTRWQSNARGGLLHDILTKSSLARLLGVSKATSISAVGRLLGVGTAVGNRDVLDRPPVRLVATGLEAQLASDQRQRRGSRFAVFVGSDGAVEGSGSHLAAHAGTREARGLGVEPVGTNPTTARGLQMGLDVAAIRRLGATLTPCSQPPPIPSSSSHPGGRGGSRDSQWLGGATAITKRQAQPRLRRGVAS